MLPKLIKPMLAQTARIPFDSEEHLFEIKWEGIRCLAFIEAGGLRLQSRQLIEITRQFPELSSLMRLPSGTVLDGELVLLKDGKPCFPEIERRAQLRHPQRIRFLSQRTPVTYMVFDLLYLRGEPLMAAPLTVRRKALRKLLSPFSLPGVLVPEGIRSHGQSFFRQVAAVGLEGIMAKRLDSPYLAGKRSPAWRKLKVSIISPAKFNFTPPIRNTPQTNNHYYDSRTKSVGRRCGGTT